MNSVSDTFKNFRTTARFAADVAVWSGNSMIRRVNAGVGGVCLVCNNLQPHGHENTWGRAGASWMEKVSDHDGLHALNMTRNTDITTLVLEDISTKKILETREIDERTRLPKRKCRYCRLLCDIFDAFFIDEYMSWITETHNDMPIHFGLMIREGLPLIVNCWSFTYDKYILSPRVDLEVYSDSTPHGTTPLAGVPSMGEVGSRAENAGSETCMSFIKECVLHCRSEHKPCRQKATKFMPTRLIYLGKSNDDLQICESNALTKGVAWAALSHCWGDGQPFKLQRANLSSLKQHMDSSHLPVTFLNAIEVARELHLLYLWIDSLCIIQDETSDWEIEAARMEMVYGQALVVICAASSPNPDTSFLGPRDKDWLPKRFQFEADGGTKTSMMVRQRSLLAAPPQQGSYEPPVYKLLGLATANRAPLQTRLVLPGNLPRHTRHPLRAWRHHLRVQDPPSLRRSTPSLPLHDPWDARRSRPLRAMAHARQSLHPAPAQLCKRQVPRHRRRRQHHGPSQAKHLPCRPVARVPAARPPVASHARRPAPRSHVPHHRADRTIVVVGFHRLRRDMESPQSTPAPRGGPHRRSRGPWLQSLRRGRIGPHLHPRARQALPHLHPLRPQRAVGVLPQERCGKQENPLPHGWPADTRVYSWETETFARRARGQEMVFEMQASATFLCIAKTPWKNYNYVGLILSKSVDEAGCMERVGNITKVPSDWYDSGEVAVVTIV